MSNKKIVIATGNKGKIAEFQNLFKLFNLDHDLVTSLDLNIQEPSEDQDNFEDIALEKARYYANLSKLPCLSDDSGLCIDYLDGFPGIYSARIAGPNKDFNIAFDIIKSKLLERGHDSSPANFKVALAFVDPIKNIQKIYSGEIKGHINFPAKGVNSFGYNSIFTPIGYNKTFAEMNEEFIISINHRYLAFKQFVDEKTYE